MTRCPRCGGSILRDSPCLACGYDGGALVKPQQFGPKVEHYAPPQWRGTPGVAPVSPGEDPATGKTVRRQSGGGRLTKENVGKRRGDAFPEHYGRVKDKLPDVIECLATGAGMTDPYRIIRLRGYGATLVDSARTTRSQEQRMDDELIVAHPDRGCRYSTRCIWCPLPVCPKELKVRVRK